MCGLDLLKLSNALGLAPWVAVGMPFQRQLSKCFPYLIIARGRGYTEVCVVVSSGISLHHRGGCSEVVKVDYVGASGPAACVLYISRQTLRERAILACLRRVRCGEAVQSFR